MAVSAISSTMIAPAVPSGLARMKPRAAAIIRRRREGVSGDVALSGSGTTDISASPGPDPWIEPGVGGVDDEVREDEDRGDEQHQSLNQRVVVVGDGVDEQLAEAVEVEDLLGHHEPA